MSKIAVIYWSMSVNTEAMANSSEEHTSELQSPCKL